MMQLAQTGVAGFLVQWATDPVSPDPTIGASGAIAVMLLIGCVFFALAARSTRKRIG